MVAAATSSVESPLTSMVNAVLFNRLVTLYHHDIHDLPLCMLLQAAPLYPVLLIVPQPCKHALLGLMQNMLIWVNTKCGQLALYLQAETRDQLQAEARD